MQEGKFRLPTIIEFIIPNKISLNMFIDRYTEIERENRILLEKMTNIMSNTNNKSTFYLPNSMAAPSMTIYVPSIQRRV